MTSPTDNKDAEKVFNQEEADYALELATDLIVAVNRRISDESLRALLFGRLGRMMLDQCAEIGRASDPLTYEGRDNLEIIQEAIAAVYDVYSLPLPQDGETVH